MQLTQTRTPAFRKLVFKEKELTFNESLFLTEKELIKIIGLTLKTNLKSYEQINSFNLHTRLITADFLKSINKEMIDTPELVNEFYKQHAKQIYNFIETHKEEIAKLVINENLISTFKVFVLSKFDTVLKKYAVKKNISYDDLSDEIKNKKIILFSQNDLLYSIRLKLKNECTNLDYLLSSILYRNFVKNNITDDKVIKTLIYKSKKHFDKRKIEPIKLFHNINTFQITPDAVDYINRKFK